MVEPNNKFKAVFNPFLRKLGVLYGTGISIHEFEDIEEWVKISFNADSDEPQYLHVQLDYDECLQLLFYPRVDGDQSLNEPLGVYFNSNHMDNVPECIKLVYNDADFDRYLDNELISEDTIVRTL